MKSSSLFLLGTALVLLFLQSCGDDNQLTGEVVVSEVNSECSFEQINENLDGLIDDAERAIMKECSDNLFTSLSELKENLIGEWELIGHGEGWVTTVSQPCGHITFTENELEFRFNDGYIDSLTTHQWEVEEIFWTGGSYFSLVCTPSTYGLHLNQFSEKYMFEDATPLDGNMYLYEKIK